MSDADNVKKDEAGQKPSGELLHDVEGFDHSKLKNVGVEEDKKTSSQARDMTMAGVQNHRPESLNRVDTQEKNVLPTKEQIEEEKKMMQEEEGKK